VAQAPLIEAMCRRGKLHAEEIGHECDEARLGQAAESAADRRRKSAMPRAILDGRVDAFRKGRAAVFAPQFAHWHSCARCSVTTSGRGSGKSNTCRGRMAVPAVRPQRRGRMRRRPWENDFRWRFGLGGLPQRFALVALLPARFSFGFLAQTGAPRTGLFSRSLDGGCHCSSLFKPTADARVRRSAPSKPRCRPSAPHKRYQFFRDGSFGDSRIIRIVESKTESAVQKI